MHKSVKTQTDYDRLRNSGLPTNTSGQLRNLGSTKGVKK